MPKSCGEENTFEQDVTDRDVVTAALTSHAEAVARRLRSDGLRGRTVTLKIKLVNVLPHTIRQSTETGCATTAT